MDEEIIGRPPDETGATRVLPSADEGATQVLGGEPDDITRVMPAAGAAPPRPPQPTLMMSRPSSSRGGVPWWVWLVVALLIAAGAAAVWYFYLRPAPPPSGDEFIGTWSPEAGTGGGLVIARSGDQFRITQYDRQLESVGSTLADLVADQLELTVQASALGLTGFSGEVQGILTHDQATDRLKLVFSSGDVRSEDLVFVRTEVLRPGSPSPTPTPTPSPSPSASPTISPTPSSSPSAAADQQVRDAIAKLQVGIITWATNNNNLYPAPQEVVNGGGISQYVNPWPTSPFTNQPMTPGTDPGDYTYEQINGGQSYKLTGYLSNGLTYTVP